MRPVFQWNIGSRVLELGKRTLVMGILNVTPDSFSDGGMFFQRDRAIEHGLHLLEDGADIVDVGGESTRPGARVAATTEVIAARISEENTAAKSRTAVSENEELERVIPVIAGLRKANAGAVISVDTYKAKVAQAAVEAGADVVNDVSGFRWDPEMVRTLAFLKCGAVMMHMRGRPEEWRNLRPIPDMVLMIKRE